MRCGPPAGRAVSSRHTKHRRSRAAYPSRQRVRIDGPSPEDRSERGGEADLPEPTASEDRRAKPGGRERGRRRGGADRAGGERDPRAGTRRRRDMTSQTVPIEADAPFAIVPRGWRATAALSTLGTRLSFVVVALLPLLSGV